MEKHWLLYSDEYQTELYAAAYNEEQIDFESQFYSEGCWFEYDINIEPNGTIFLINEKKYEKFIIFPQTPYERHKFGEEKEFNETWTAMKESVGTADVR